MLADGRTAKSVSRVQINTGDNCLKVFLLWDVLFVWRHFPPFVLMFIFFFISIFVSFSCVFWVQFTCLDCWSVCLVGWSVTCLLVGFLVGWSVVWSVAWSVDRLLVCWLVSWSVIWSVG